ncbi:MAG: NUDIX domain-containing protein [Chloroflexota bacterium]|nr:NUDIX domain-containing protein [Chloroflexota bacterium]
MAILESSTNPFKGVSPKPQALPEDPQTFDSMLQHSIQEWRSQGLLVIWLEIPLGKPDLIPIAIKSGFDFHHSGENYLMLTYCIVPNSFIPPYATHYIGAGGVVLNNKDELLVVCERYRQPGQPPFYKLPGGALTPSENLAEAVVREVLEETGVQATFDSLVCFRHMHSYRYGKSDIYFVCRLRPLTEDITMQAEEIEDCQWMPVQEFLNSEETSTFNKSIVRAALESEGIRPIQIEGLDDAGREFFMPAI